MRALSAVLFAALDLLSVLHGHFALRAVDESDETENCNDEHKEDHEVPGCVLIRSPLRDILDDRKTCGRKDTDEDDEGDTVADTEISKLLAQHRADEEADELYGHCKREHVVVARGEISGAAEGIYDTDGLDDCENDGKHAREHSHFAFAFVALLAPALESGYRYREKLRYDGRVDIRRDTECEQRAVLERVAGNAVEQGQERVYVFGLLELCSQKAGIESGNGDPAAHSVYEENEQREQELRADFLIL